MVALQLEGDALNVALLVSAATQERIIENIEIDELGTLRIKGKK